MARMEIVFGFLLGLNCKRSTKNQGEPTMVSSLYTKVIRACDTIMPPKAMAEKYLEL